MDRLTREQRSRNMSAIRSKDTKPELMLRRATWKRGLRYRNHYTLPGRPDLVFVRAKVAVFMDGCFWHKCPRCYRAPRSNKEYWHPKIAANARRDRKQTQQLRKEGWVVIRFWEHQVKENPDRCAATIQKILSKADR